MDNRTNMVKHIITPEERPYSPESGYTHITPTPSESSAAAAGGFSEAENVERGECFRCRLETAPLLSAPRCDTLRKVAYAQLGPPLKHLLHSVPTARARAAEVGAWVAQAARQRDALHLLDREKISWTGLKLNSVDSLRLANFGEELLGEQDRMSEQMRGLIAKDIFTVLRTKAVLYGSEEMSTPV